MERNNDLELASYLHLKNCQRAREALFPAFLLNRYPVEMTDQRPRILISALLQRAVRAGFPKFQYIYGHNLQKVFWFSSIIFFRSSPIFVLIGVMQP